MALYGFDAFSPAEIAERVERVGVAKARLPLVTLVMLALQRVLGGVVFSLGLLLVVGRGQGHAYAATYLKLQRRKPRCPSSRRSSAA